MSFSFREIIFGKPRKIDDPGVYHSISLIAFFAWVGLGADGLSSSAYGPEEAFHNLVGHEYLVVFLALATALTVFILSFAYSRIIEHFPNGGGGYLVSTKLLGDKAGLVSGCSLLVDYVLTIAISISAGVNAIFAFLPLQYHGLKLTAALLAIVLLLVLNLRGIKESVYILTPIFIVFLITHIVLIAGVIFQNFGKVVEIPPMVHQGITRDLSSLGWVAILMIFARAYSLGGGTYTGIEAVSNGLTIMREPRVLTAKRTMLYMALSLALTAGGLLLAYLLADVHPVLGKPMNATLAERFFETWSLGGFQIGKGIVIVTLFSEGALLFVAAQAGFIDGPRVMANLALDSWMPHQFSALSERLTIQNGVTLMGGAALLTVFYTKANVHVLVVMYSINVFMTFLLSNLGMTKLNWNQLRAKVENASRTDFWVHLSATVLCGTILVVTIFEKFAQGGWITLLLTGSVIGFCMVSKNHYRKVAQRLKKLDKQFTQVVLALGDSDSQPQPKLDSTQPTAVLLVAGFSSLGVHTLLKIQQIFPNHYHQAIFASIGVLDSGNFKGAGETESLRLNVLNQLTQYVDLAKKKMGWAATYEMSLGTEVAEELHKLCTDIHRQYPHSVFFTGKLVFPEPSWWHKIFHNETAFAVQRRIGLEGMPMVVIPVRVPL